MQQILVHVYIQIFVFPVRNVRKNNWHKELPIQQCLEEPIAERNPAHLLFFCPALLLPNSTKERGYCESARNTIICGIGPRGLGWVTT